MNFKKGESTFFETSIITFFWLSSVGIALFPDLISDFIAQVFGIKSNINALLFFAIGLLFYFQLQLYKITKKQDAYLTELTRKTALNNVENEPIEA